VSKNTGHNGNLLRETWRLTINFEGTQFSDKRINFARVCTFFTILLFRAPEMLEGFLFRGRYTSMRMIGAGQFGTAGLPSLQLASVASHVAASCVRWCRAVWPLGLASCRRRARRVPVGSWMGRMGCDSCDSCDRWPSNTSRSRPTFRRCPSFVMCFEAERMQNMSFSESWIDVYQCWEIYVWIITYIYINIYIYVY
jgi:hypothetical protein